MDLLPFALLVCHIYQIAVVDPGSHRKGQGKGILKYWCGLHGADDRNDGNGCFQWAEVQKLYCDCYLNRIGDGYH